MNTEIRTCDEQELANLRADIEMFKSQRDAHVRQLTDIFKVLGISPAGDAVNVIERLKDNAAMLLKQAQEAIDLRRTLFDEHAILTGKAERARKQGKHRRVGYFEERISYLESIMSRCGISP